METFSRYRRLSKFAKFSAYLSHVKILQTKSLAAKWPGAPIFDPIRILPGPPPPKKNLMLVTVGATLPFDRMVDGILSLKTKGQIPEHLIIQSGASGREWKAIDDVEIYKSLPFDKLLTISQDASIVVCHGGSGSLIPALQTGCRVVAMPRRSGLEKTF